MKAAISKISAGYVRSFIFGVEDSLVSTVGLLAGVASAGIPRTNIILTGLVLIFVEAFSMAVGNFLSEHSAEEYAVKKDISSLRSIMSGVIMFFSYFIFGFIPLFPYILISAKLALWVSIASSLFVLFLLGILSAKVSRINIWLSSVRMLLVGGIAIGIGVMIGRILK